MLSGNINGIRRAAAWMLLGVMVCGFIGCGQKEDTDGKNEGTPEAQVTKGAESDVQVTQGAEPEQDATDTAPTEPAKEVRTDFYISSIDEEIPSMSEYWKDYFSIGSRLQKGNCSMILRGILLNSSLTV